MYFNKIFYTYIIIVIIICILFIPIIMNSNYKNLLLDNYLIWPTPSSHTITCPFGQRTSPTKGASSFHTGIDIGASYGSNIVAAESGTVILASYGWNGSYGNYIIINHGNGITTRYAHASKLYVTTGQTVTKGQVIAAVGESGRAYGAHLHFEVRKNGSHTNPLNYL